MTSAYDLQCSMNAVCVCQSVQGLPSESVILCPMNAGCIRGSVRWKEAILYTVIDLLIQFQSKSIKLPHLNVNKLYGLIQDTGSMSMLNNSKLISFDFSVNAFLARLPNWSTYSDHCIICRLPVDVEYWSDCWRTVFVTFYYVFICYMSEHNILITVYIYIISHCTHTTVRGLFWSLVSKSTGGIQSGHPFRKKS